MWSRHHPPGASISVHTIARHETAALDQPTSVWLQTKFEVLIKLVCCSRVDVGSLTLLAKRVLLHGNVNKAIPATGWQTRGEMKGARTRCLLT